MLINAQRNLQYSEGGILSQWDKDIITKTGSTSHLEGAKNPESLPTQCLKYFIIIEKILKFFIKF